MKILEINSSYRKNGNTEHIIRLIEHNLTKSAKEKKLDIDIEYLSIADNNISACLGCRACFDRGEEKCPLRDDLTDVRTKLMAADGIILGSPVYVEDINGIMKNWIDRMAFYCHRPAFMGKSALVLTTSGGGATNHALRTMKNALSAWGFRIAAQKNFRMGAYMKNGETEKSYGDMAGKLAEDLIKSIIKNNSFQPSFYSYLIFKVQQKYWQKEMHQDNKYDYEFWKKKGWLKPECVYYIEHKAAPVKSRLARFLGSIAAKFFI